MRLTIQSFQQFNDPNEKTIKKNWNPFSKH